MQFFKCIGNHEKEPTFTYFDDTNQPVHIKLGNISAVYSNKKWKIEKDKDNDNDIIEESSDERTIDDSDKEFYERKSKNKNYNKKLKKRNEELENENRQLKWKIEILLSKLAEARFEIQQLQEVE